jgi:hypothetical protein
VTTQQTTQLPLKVSQNRRFLVVQNDAPFLIHGDTAWSIITAITREEAEQYLADRAEKGFNALIINLIEHKFNGPLTRTGEHPFKNPLDVSTPNDAYFDYAAWVIERAASYGMVIFLAPMYLGYKHPLNDDGWYQEARLSGPEKCYRYGRYLGKRFAGFNNIIWMMGGDRNPDGVVEEHNSLLMGIKENDKHSLFTAHPHPEEPTPERYGGTNWGGWLDVNVTYTYGIVHRRLLADYTRRPVLPFVLIESSYEGEHNATPVQIRRQAYWANLSGACGQFLGNNPIWLYNPGWKEAMNLEGSKSMVHVKTFFQSRPWHELVPDSRRASDGVTAVRTNIIVSGVGELNGMDYMAAARTADGSTIMAYMPTAREVTLDLGRVRGNRCQAWWFDPRSGKSQPAGEYPTGGEQRFNPPGEGDWGLVIDDVEKNYPAPGA